VYAAVARSKDPFHIPKAGLEIAPVAGLASINVNGSVGAVPAGEFLGESTLGGVVVYAIYQALLTGLRTEAMRRRGHINRATQIQLVAQTVWASVKEGAAVSAVLAVVLLVFPWMFRYQCWAWWALVRRPLICSMPSGMGSLSFKDKNCVI